MRKRKTLEQLNLLLEKSDTICIVCARGLGDALLSMILAHNLFLSGKQVSLFSNFLIQLTDWFPDFTILPEPPAEKFSEIFTSFDTIIAAEHAFIHEKHSFGNQLIILKESSFNKSLSMVDNLQLVCKQRFSLPFFYRENGIRPLKGLQLNAHPKRVILHPMSSNAKKNWPSAKFISLAKRLEREGYSPFFCMSLKERPWWEGHVPSERLPLFHSVSDLASFVYESGFMIGNDSGIGHLASALNIPTLSIFARKSYSHLWRPDWSKGVVASPLNLLPGSRLKQRYWKNLLSVSRVLKKFKEI